MIELNYKYINEYMKFEEFSSNSNLKKTDYQLSDIKKINLGFNIEESVIDVGQDEYAVSSGMTMLYTYGIGPCCALVFCDEHRRLLFHLDGVVTLEDILEVTDKFNWSSSMKLIIAPGFTCGTDGSFKYQEVADYFKSKGYEVVVNRIPLALGFVLVGSEKVMVGTKMDSDYDVTIGIPLMSFPKIITENSDERRSLVELKTDLILRSTLNEHNDLNKGLR